MLQKTLRFFTAVLAFLTALSQMVFTPNVIRVDFDTVVGEMKPVHNVGRMPEYTLDSEINRYFTGANMTSCRTHDINVTDMHRIFPDFSKDPDDESAYCFAECDNVLAAIVDTGMEPFFRLGVSWSDPVASRAHLQPPADYGKWAQVCEHIIRHYNEGWNNGFRYHIQYWEIYNEPDCQPTAAENNFWQGTSEEFYRLYDSTAQYLKNKFPALKIGGYGSCGFYALTKTNAVNTGSSEQTQYFITFFDGFLDYIAKHGTPLDFFTWHSYTTTEKNARYIDYVHKKLNKAGYADTEVIIDEWNYNPMKNDEIDRRYGANQTSMLIMFQNKGLDLAHYYCGIYYPASVHAGMFVKDGIPSSAYYGFRAFGQMYRLGSQASVNNLRLAKDLYAVAATGDDGQALLMANVSENKDRKLRIDAGAYTVDKCMTVNEACEWVEIPLPDVIESGSMLYVTFRKA